MTATTKAIHTFASFGLLVILSYAFNLLRGIYARLIRPAKNLKKAYGSWAVITGATDGIGNLLDFGLNAHIFTTSPGYAMAEEFARKGLNIVLISRSIEKLERCAKILREQCKVEVKILDIDFGCFDSVVRKRVNEALKDLDLGVLVNNVGVSYPFTKYFDELTDGEVEGLIRLNVDSTTWMTRIALPIMLAKRKGAIVNIGSAAGVSTSPLLAQYGAAKSYVAMLSKALNGELSSKGVHVQCQVPMFVATKLAKIRKSSLFVASPSGYAKAAVASIGYETVVSPFWSHALQIWALTNFPEWVVSWGTKSMHLGIRSAGMKKELMTKKN